MVALGEIDMSQPMKKPAARPKRLDPTYGVDAIPNAGGDGFIAFYRMPGLAPGYIRDPGTNRVSIFETEDAAVAAGARRLFEVMNTPRVRAKANSGKREKYERLSGPEFAQLLQESGITLTFFAFLYGTTERRVLGWIDGVNEKGEVDLAPHPARVMLELFKANQSNIDLAEQITDSVTTARTPNS
jgi:hypothetical protein